MTWQVGLYGDGVLSSKAVDKWLAESIDASGMRDFVKQSPAWFASDFRTQLVGDLLADIAKFNEGSGSDYIQLSTAANSLRVRAVLSEGYVHDWLGRIVAAIRAAGRTGFVGNVYLLGLGEPIAAQLSVSKKSAKWEELHGPAAQMVNTPRTIEELDTISRARSGQAVAPPVKTSAPTRIPMPKAAAADLGKVAKVLEDWPAAEVFAACKRAGITVLAAGKARLLHDLVESPAALLLACCGTSPTLAAAGAVDVFGMSVAALPAFGIRILAELDPKAAAPLAGRLFSEDWPDLSQPGALSVRLAAAHALARAGDEKSLAMLVGGLSMPGSYCSADALTRVVDKRVQAQILQDAERRAKKVRKADADEFGNTLDLLARLRLAEALPFLVALWTSGPARVRFRAGLALLDFDTSDALAPLVGHTSDKDELVASISALALIRSKPKRAFDELSGLFASKKQYPLASRVLAVLTRGRDALAPAAALSADRATVLSLDPRWFQLAQRLLDDADFGPLAFAFLTVHRRGGIALAERLGTSRDEAICHALEYLGDPDVIPAMKAYAAKLKKGVGRARVLEAINRIERGERPLEPFVQED